MKRGSEDASWVPAEGYAFKLWWATDPHRFDRCTVTRTMGGEFDGWRAEVDLALDDSRVAVDGAIRLVPPAVTSVHDLTAPALRQLQLGDMLPGLIRLMDSPAFQHSVGARWLPGLLKNRQGRAGTPARYYLEWARLRVEAEREAPGAAIPWMAAQTGETEGAINALLNRARHRHELLTGKGRNIQLTDTARQMLGEEG